MYKFTYNDSHTAEEQYRNAIEVCRNMLDAANEGGTLDGKRANSNRRFKVQKGNGGGYDELGHHDTYYLADFTFDVYESGMVDVSYPFDTKLKTSYGVLTRAECLVFVHLQEIEGINMVEYANEVLASVFEDNDGKVA